jgi:hypothetical protein
MVRRISSPRFVGRVAELEALDELLRQAWSGSGGGMVVVGDAGIGKSRLVVELGTRVRATGALVLVGECVELAEGELAFSPIISALRGAMADAGAVEGLGRPLRSALAALWPVPGAVEDASGGREQLFEGVYQVLARLAERQPVLLIVEDVHWIDLSSRDLLAFLVANARRDPIVLVVTYRPDELHRGHPLRPFLVELERSGRGQRVELEGFTRSEVAEQLQAIAGHVPDGGVIERIFRRSEGNPFYAEELLASAQDGGGQLPASLRDTLLLRVERLCWARCERRLTTTCSCRARTGRRVHSATRCCARRSMTTHCLLKGCGYTARSRKRLESIANTPGRRPRRSWPTIGTRPGRSARH